MKSLFALILFVVSNTLISQNHENSHELAVINIQGAKVFELPTFESRVVSILPVGEVVKIQETIESKEEYSIGIGFSLPGMWIKPMEFNGYIFSAELTNRKIEMGINEYGIHWIRIYGEFIEVSKFEEMITSENGVFPSFTENEHYQYAIYTTVTTTDRCYFYKAQYINLELNEVYFQLISDYLVVDLEGSALIPRFIEINGNEIIFEVYDQIDDLKINTSDIENIFVTSYYCD